MASQFESLKMPFIIMFSIPFAFSGAILALLITDTTLSIVAALGAVMLIGIVVKNAIVLVDYINLMRDRGHNLNEAIIMSGKSRLRPVLMTALTTILAMIPLAFSKGEGSEMWSPMGISVIGGLIFSTMVTMIIVPVMYRIFAAKGERDKKKKVQKKYVFMDN
jgi:HAE1 family hydrophobic/amphiphilic exporter-1